MKNVKTFRGRPILSPGDVFDIDGINYEIITATSGMVGGGRGGINLTKPVFILENTATKERINMKESVLRAKFKEAIRNDCET